MFKNYKNIKVKAISLIIVLLIVWNQFAWQYPGLALNQPPEKDTLRATSAARTEGQAENMQSQLESPNSQPGKTAKTSSAGKFESISIEEITSIGENGDRRVKVKAYIKRFGTEKEEVIIYGRWRKGSWQKLYSMFATGKKKIDDSIVRLLEQNPPVDNIIIERAEFQEGSLLTLPEISSITVAAEDSKRGRAFLGQCESLIGNGVSLFYALTEMAYNQGFLSSEDLLYYIPEDNEKQRFYTDKLNFVKILTGEEAPETLKFYFAGRRAQRIIFGQQSKYYADLLGAIRRKEAPNEKVDSYTENAKRLERVAIAVEGKGEHEKAAIFWGNAQSIYFQLNNFGKAVFCKHKIAENLRWGSKPRYDQGELKKALGLVKQALHLYEGLGDEYKVAVCWGILGQYYSDLNEFKEAAGYFQKAAERMERLQKFRPAAIYYAQAALAYVKLSHSVSVFSQGKESDYSIYCEKAALCNKSSAELNLKIDEELLAIEHFIYAATDFKKANMLKEAEVCRKKAVEINSELFRRIETIKSIFKNTAINRRIVDRLKHFPEMLVLLKFKPAASQPFRDGDEELIRPIGKVLQRSFRGQIRLIAYVAPAAPGADKKESQRQYLIYDIGMVKQVIKDNKDLFPSVRLSGLKTRKLDRFMIEEMEANQGRECLFLGYPRRDVDDLIRLRPLIEKLTLQTIQFALLSVRNDLKKIAQLPEKTVQLPERTAQLSEDDLTFIGRFHRPWSEWIKRRSSASLDERGYDWPTYRTGEEQILKSRCQAMMDIGRVLIGQESPEDAHYFMRTWSAGESEPVAAALTRERRTSRYFATQA